MKEKNMIEKIDKSKLTLNYEYHQWKFGEKAPKEDLEYLYCELRLSQDEIGEIIHKGGSTVARWLDFYKIRKPATKVDGPVLTAEQIKQIDWSRMSRNFIEHPWKKTDTPLESDFRYLYLELNWSLADIAQLLGRSASQVQKIVTGLGLYKTKEQHQASRENACERKYGTKYTISMPEVREKIEKTTLNNTGYKSVLESREIREQGMIKKYGKAHPQQVESIRQKTCETVNERYGEAYYFQTEQFKKENKSFMEEKYGVDNYAKTDEFKEKMQNRIKEYNDKNNTNITSFSQLQSSKDKTKETSQKRYGTDHPSQADVVKEKVHETVKEKYNCDSVFQLPHVREAQKTGMVRRYGVDNPAYIHVKHIENITKDFWLAHFIDKRSGAFDVSKCAKYHHMRDGAILNWKKKLGITIRNKGGSIIEGDITGLLSQLGEVVETKNRTALGETKLELDVFLPERRIGIEYDGLLFHSQGKRDYGRIRNHGIEHLQYKYTVARDCNIRLFNIFESEWKTPEKYKIWQGILKRSIGKLDVIDVRECIIKQIDEDDASDFLEENHLHGSLFGCDIYLGMYYQETIIAVMSIKKITNNSYEITRYAEHREYSVPKGFNTLVREYLGKHNTNLIFRADLRYEDLSQFNGILKRSDDTPPVGYVFKTENSKVIRDYSIEPLSNYNDIMVQECCEHYSPQLSLVDNLYEHDYRTIYDCGRAVYKYTVDKQV